MVVFLFLSLRNTDGTVFQGANSLRCTVPVFIQPSRDALIDREDATQKSFHRFADRQQSTNQVCGLVVLNHIQFFLHHCIWVRFLCSPRVVVTSFVVDP
jgi:hypothetical protein